MIFVQLDLSHLNLSFINYNLILMRKNVSIKVLAVEGKLIMRDRKIKKIFEGYGDRMPLLKPFMSEFSKV